MNTTTLDLQTSDALSRAFARLQSFGQWLNTPQPTVPEASAELLRLAAQYEDSQPSYAADLRAAAMADERALADAI